MAVRIAVAQAASVPGDVAANARQAADLVRRAASDGARLVVLPELFLCGYDIPGIVADPGRYVVDLTIGPRPSATSPWAAISTACADTGCAALVGAAVRQDPAGPVSNAVVAFASDGSVAGRYAKTHLWREENEAFEPGDELLIVVVDGLAVGVGVCYDAGFPELTRAYALAGAHAVVFSSAFATGDTEHRYDVYHPARALENTVYVLVSNLLGTATGEEFFGRSAAFSPTGHVAARLGAAEGVACVDVDDETLRRAREELPYLRQARFDLLTSVPGSPVRPRRVDLSADTAAPTPNPDVPSDLSPSASSRPAH